MPLSATSEQTGDLPEHVVRHLYRTLPAGHAGGLDCRAVHDRVAALVASPRADLWVERVEDAAGLAAVALLKERRSGLTGEREGFLYCLVPARCAPPVAGSVATSLDRLMRRRRWGALRVSLFTADAPALRALTETTNLELGWIVTRKRIRAAPDADALPGTTRPARRQDLAFISAGWRDAFLAGLQAERSWQGDAAAREAADAELAQLLGSEHCVLLVIEAGGEPVGFVAAEVGRPEELTGRRECHLYDCYVSPPYRARGFSQRGTSSLERLALDRGCEYVSGTVTGSRPERIDAILSQLEPHGWTSYQTIYRCRAPLLRAKRP